MSGDINVQSFSGKVNISNNLLVGSSHLFVDTVNNRVGITTGSPGASLEVNGNVHVGTDLTLGGTLTGDGSGLTNVNSDSGLWAGAGTGSVYLSTSTDNVGIGTTSPDARLHLEEPSAISATTRLFHTENAFAGGSRGHFEIIEKKTGAGTGWSDFTLRLQRRVDVTEQGYIEFNPSGSTGDYGIAFGNSGGGGAGEIMRIVGQSGNVGIGTTSPSTRLHVNHDLHLEASSEAWNTTVGKGLYLRYSLTGGQDTAYIQSIDRSNTSLSYPMIFQASSYQFSVGDVGIGKTPSEKLHVHENLSTSGHQIMARIGGDTSSYNTLVFGSKEGRPHIGGHRGDFGAWADLSFQNDLMILQQSTERVGIGVSDPDSKLEVRGNIRASFSDTNHGMFIDAAGTIRRDYGGNGVGLHFTANQIFPTNYLGSYSAGGIDLGSSSYRWNNVYTEALNASGTIDSTGIITCNANKMVITGSSPTLYLRDSNARTGMIHQNDNRMYFLSGVANSDSWTQTANSRWPLYLQMDTNEAVFGGNIDAAVGTVTASTFSTTSQLYLGTSASIRQTSTPGWTGNPGSGIGKIEYHSNRWYIVAGSNSSELLRVRRNESDKFVIDNNGSISLGTVPAARISGTVGTATNQSGGTVSCTSGSFSGQFSASTASSRDKFRVYPASSYCIGMQSGVTFGDLNDWAMTFQMNNDNDRGFWWGDDGHGVNQGAMALSTRGWLNVAERIKVGGGQTDTGAAGWNLQVQGNAYISSSLECDGRIYADNGCHVRGDWLRVNGTNGLYFESYGGGWFMNDSTWVQTYNSKGLYVNNQIRMASLRALGGTFASRLDWPNSGHHVDCYHNLSGHVFHINYYAQQSVYLNRTAYSDRRIKEDIKDIDDVSALNILRKIKPKTYKYKLQPHKGTVYGFIAQDVREVLPYATNLTKLSAPFDREKFVNATILENGVVNLDKPCNELEIGKNAYFYYESSTSTRDFEVTEITSPTQFRVRIDEGGTEWIGNTILVGKEVDDFHGIDKDAIFTVATAALQEVDRQLQAEKVKTHQMEEDLQAEKARTYELQKKVELLEMSHTSLIQRIEALENL